MKEQIFLGRFDFSQVENVANGGRQIKFTYLNLYFLGFYFAQVQDFVDQG